MGKIRGKNGKLLPNSLRIITSCLKTVSTNANTAVRSAGASLAASISSGDDRKEQVLWAGFDKLENSPASFRRVLLLGYLKGFQVFDVEDASDLSELVSKRDGPVTFLQMLPFPANSEGSVQYQLSHPIMVVVGGIEDERITHHHNTGLGPVRNGPDESSPGSLFSPPTAVQFYSMKSNEYVKVVNFKSPVLMVRCSQRVVAVALEEQVYCFDTQNLEKKFMVVTYPVPRVAEHSASIGYGPMAVGPRWLAYPPNRPFMVNMGRVSPKSLSTSVSPSTSPGGSSMMARYAMESSKQLAAGLLTLGDMGYKKLSKYYPERRPDSPSSPGWKSLAASEPENAGIVAVRDLVSSEIIAQFQAHSSPISGLCFDPSGTLLVTASVHGNNINIFRIMPCHKCSGSSSHDWSRTYVHLYKLYRGVTSAVIQDICFSHYSQWIGIISSRGTCHIYSLSPFGGDNNVQTRYAQGKETYSSSLPWWSTSTFALNEPSTLPPPPTCNLSVLTRIKCSDSGLVNTVSNAAASVIGKLWVPSGAVAAVFHNSNSSGGNALEYVLVYTPTGFVVQHKISMSMGLEPNENGKQSLLTQQVNPQNEESRVKVDPVQWWDVCRRLDNMEREESISTSFFDGHSNSEIGIDGASVFKGKATAQGRKSGKIDSVKPQDRSSDLHLSNAEVQINSCRFPLWQKKSKICFHVMESPETERPLAGEFEIEKASSHELVIKPKELLPIFEHFPSSRSSWADRSAVHNVVNHPTLSSNSFPARGKTGSFIRHSKSPSFNPTTETSKRGSSERMEDTLNLDFMNINRPPPSRSVSYSNAETGKSNLHTATNCNMRGDSFIVNGNNADSTRDGILTSSEAEEDNVNFARLMFNEGYCDKQDVNHGSTEAVNDETDTNGSNHDGDRTDEEGGIGGMFDLEEG